MFLFTDVFLNLLVPSYKSCLCCAEMVLILLLLLVANSHMLLTYHQDELAMDTSLFLF